MEVKKVKAKVLMLPTEKQANSIIMLAGKLVYTNRYPSEYGLLSHQLYFTTDDEIKEGDWVYGYSNTVNLNDVFRVSKVDRDGNIYDGIVAYPKHYCKKIVATTDSSLTIQYQTSQGNLYNEPLPQPSQAFVKKYCELGGIDEVMIDYTRDEKSMLNNIRTKGEESDWYIKTDSYNTITIHSVKDSWSREEVEKLTEDAFYEGINTANSYGDMIESYLHWIKQNL